MKQPHRLPPQSTPPFDPKLDYDEADFKPTMTLPGTDARVKVMAWRLENGFPPCHPNDRTCEGAIGGINPARGSKQQPPRAVTKVGSLGARRRTKAKDY